MKPELIWEIQVQHLDEAEFLLEMWQHCAGSPKYTLEKLEWGPEERLLAHMAGLRMGGADTVNALLLPALGEADEDELRAAAAGLAILDGAGDEACGELLVALAACETPEGERGLSWALGLSPRAGLVPWISHGIEALEGPALRGRLRALSMHRVDTGSRLVPWLNAGDVELTRVASHLARHTGDHTTLGELAKLTRSPDALARWVALESGLIRGLPWAWELLCEEAAQPQVPARQRETLGWMAMLGDPGVHAQLFAAMSTPSTDLLWALGLTGRAQAVDFAVELLDNEALARSAGEVVCTVAGLDSRADVYWLDHGLVPVGEEPDAALPPLEEDDLEASLVAHGDGSLRLPEAGAVRAWWGREREHFVMDQRYSRGRPFSGEQLLCDLREGCMRLCHPRALELAARTVGQAQIQTHALAGVQRVQLQALATRVAGVDCQQGRPFG